MKFVKVYFIEGCPYCKEAKDFLKSKNIQFEEVDVEKNEEAAEDIIERTGQSGFPIIEIDGELVIGFDKEQLEELLSR